MDIHLPNASDIIDKFEALMSQEGISIPRLLETGADMMSVWSLLKLVRQDFSGTADEIRPTFTAAVGAHDLAAKVLEVSGHPDFNKLLPHLQMLNNGVVHLFEEPSATSDTYNKLVELYWACLCMSLGHRIDLDHPQRSRGTNPDVITLDQKGDAAHGYAFKTVRSLYTQSVYEHIVKGIDQIERSPAREGIVALHLTPRIAKAGFWPTGGYYQDWRPVAWQIVGELQKAVTSVVEDNGQATIDSLFKGKKAVGGILCMAFCPIVAKHPESAKAVVMPLKIATLVDLYTGTRMSNDFLVEVARVNHAMQMVLGS